MPGVVLRRHSRNPGRIVNLVTVDNYVVPTPFQSLSRPPLALKERKSNGRMVMIRTLHS